jgi:hypothetical protein
MSPRFTLGLILVGSLLSACSLFDQSARQDELDKMRKADDMERQQRLLAEGKLNPQEYEALAIKMGWPRPDARGIPPPPTTDELEKKVKASQSNP